MLKCQVCDHPNEFGRVFCESCGSKLALSRVTRQDLQPGRPRRKRRGSRLFLFLLLLACVACCVLPFWPRDLPVARRGDPNSVQELLDRFELVSTLETGQTAAIKLTEAGINEYLRSKKAESLNCEYIAVTVANGAVVLSGVYRPDPVSAGGFTWEPRMSFEFTFRPVDGWGACRNVRIGHLPLPGVTARPLVSYLHRIIMEQHEWRLVSQAKQIDTGTGTLTLLYEK